MAYPLGPMTRAPARPEPTPVTAATEPAAPAPLAMLTHASARSATAVSDIRSTSPEISRPAFGRAPP